MLLNSKSIHPLTQDLQAWYARHKRDLPWREKPEAYFVWLAEIIFQQTRIEQGLSYFEKISENYPTVCDLAIAEENELLKLWEGLGYYSRARNLHYSAKVIVEKFDGVFPSEYKDILSLKGVGPYTAAAIASIAFNLPYPAIDGNVLRVCSRLFCIEDAVNTPKAYKKIENELLILIDHERPGDFNQAMMELGSLVCKPQNPDCEECPLLIYCEARKKGKEKSLPLKNKKQSVKKVYFNYHISLDKEWVHLEKRSEGIWKNLYQFPLLESEKILDEEEMYSLISGDGNPELFGSKTYKHILSHRVIYAKFWFSQKSLINPKGNFIKVEKKDLKNYPMPRLITRFLESEEAKKYILT